LVPYKQQLLIFVIYPYKNFASIGTSAVAASRLYQTVFPSAIWCRPTLWFLPRCMECRRGLAMRILSVRPSVRPSVKRVHSDKTEEKSVKIFILCEII